MDTREGAEGSLVAPRSLRASRCAVSRRRARGEFGYHRRVLLLSSELRAALDGRASRDPRVALACETAAALHLGRAPRAPLVVATRREPATTDRRLRAIAPLAATAPVARAEGASLSSLEQTVVDLLLRPTEAGGVALAGALVRAGSALERRAFDAASFVRLVTAHGRPALLRRAAYLLGRAGLDAGAPRLAAAARGPAVALDPLGPPGGARLPRAGLRLNVADGFDDPEGTIAPLLAEEVRARLGPLAVDVALAVLARARLDPELRGGPLRPLHEAAARCAREGLLRLDGAALEPLPPFDAACALILACAGRRGRARAARLAAALDARASGPARVDALSILAVAGDEAGARARLAAVTPYAEALDAERAARLLALTERAEHARDGALTALRLRLLERLGRWEPLVREARALAKKGRPDVRRAAALAVARGCWRLGRHEECLAHVRALQRVLVERPDPSLEAEVALLRATIAVERGEHARAEKLLRGLLRGAERAGDDLDRARALHRLGALDARRGRLVEAAASYRAALEALPEGPARAGALRGVLRSNLAATALWLGRWEEAQQLAERALAEKQAGGTAGEILVTRVLLARIARARGEQAPAAGRMPELVEATERSGDARLRVEACLDLAEEHARAGDVRAAEQAVERARTALALLAGAEPILEAIAAHVAGLVAACGGDLAGGVAQMDEAAARLDRQGGAFWSARARRDAASACERGGLREEALVRFDAVARACQRLGFVLGEEERHASLYALASLEGGGLARPHAERVVARLGSGVVRARLLAEGRRALADALRARRPEAPRADAVAVVRSAAGARFVDAAERAALLRGTPRTLLLDEGSCALVRPDGARVPLGRRRTLAPLLRAIAARPGEAVSLAQLARDVWQRRDGASTRAAIKMSVSRLRALLGPHRSAIQAARARDGLAYLWTDALELHQLAPIEP